MPRDLGPILHAAADGRHTYRSNRAPEHLLTRPQLRALGLSAAGLRPAAWLHYNPFHATCPLFDRSEAKPVRKLTERQLENLARGRLLANTAPCAECATTRVRWRSTWEGTPVCDTCAPVRQERQRREAAERWAAEQRAHTDMLARDKREASEWARRLLALVDGPPALPLDGPAGLLPAVVDTETTGLAGYVVDLAVVQLDGTVLLDTLVDPQMPIPPDATDIHGITDEMVAGKPTFGQLLDRLSQILAGRRVLIWNAAFDVGVFERELERLHGVNALEQPPAGAGLDWSPDRQALSSARARAAEWMAAHLPDALVDCAMNRHAAFWGAWDDWHGSYTWQRLNGPHRALGDCLKVIRRLREMADDDGTERE
ncbi:3'-5' exonuclease [Kitasatospora aureofaciens]|uniref:3'-5' exonuclease n=1 Tax=Kitasatospora aureofaciens TaxID=1894 RepID=UPI0033F050A2